MKFPASNMKLPSFINKDACVVNPDNSNLYALLDPYAPRGAFTYLREIVSSQQPKGVSKKSFDVEKVRLWKRWIYWVC
jgi:hypothetical protein